MKKIIFFLFISLQSLGQERTDSTYISFGGDVRYQYFLFKNEEWGAAPADRDGYILMRYLGHADLHMGKHFRTFVQLQSSLAGGKEKPPSPVDENQLDLHQAFIDLKLKKFTLRIGRQEFSFGSQRLVSVREGPNNRQAFDAIDLQYGKSHLFFSHYVLSKQKIFDDKFDHHTKFWGLYMVFKHLDLYYLGLQKGSTAFDDGTGKELRHSVGTRAFNKTSRWQYDFEAVYQWGNSAAAGSAHGRLRQTLLIP